MSRVTKRVLEYSITTCVCAALVFGFLIMRGIFNHPNLKTTMHYFTDAFFAVGLLCVLFGLMVVVYNGGVFDMLFYGVYRFITLFKKDHKKVKYQTYYDFHIYRAEKEKAEFLYMIIVGAAYVTISMIFLAIWYQL